MVKTFKDWLVSEAKDIFGFEGREVVRAADTEDRPVVTISSDIIMEHMMHRKLGGMEPFSQYHDQIQWGREPGAVRMVISPLGSFKSVIRKLQEDLRGERVWTCREIIPYRDMLRATRAFDESMAEDIFSRVERCWREDVRAPSGEYSGLEALTLRVAAGCRRRDVMPEIMVFGGVKAVERGSHYNIHFGCRGHGVEAPGGMRMEQFSIDMSYDRGSGMVRSYGYPIQSPTRQHLWQVQPSEWDELFSPSQDPEEVVAAISAAFSTF